ncbi:hypothetical protein DTO006G1_4576 [Penicillium roqueforti]|uniref:Uncharacterized protein n=1 Tax=Penicillium roqueforti (strain FM164) TaxID=1365484 RepID=W6QBR0_PENRF|nr:uncharacterized protein LCP9604111_2759 [Penicillium roqueforti]CDM33890.1 hypothetical protein PROQFM164_S03g000614 [Penicillium roqueforti FM164]KAF9251358.1 hypothetical protein LCP9604111_2759 [Penicillium roqueforti]KAI1837765.1 hypothetical protein CBS147337_988 [Penicillium roqueforti]KAI2681868.1 hypothetical protein CBS147355_3078 [Penicillium roqueforti]KAI2689258.1 hypothetical protein LCP963914a_2347 [Penicillium roqueforti]
MKLILSHHHHTSITMPSTQLTQVPQSVLDLSGDLEELVYTKAAIGIYDRTMLAIVNPTTTPMELNLHHGSWLQAKSKVASLHRSIVADFNRLPRQMKRTFVRANRLTLSEHGFRPSADNLEITRPGSRRAIALL